MFSFLHEFEPLDRKGFGYHPSPNASPRDLRYDTTRSEIPHVNYAEIPLKMLDFGEFEAETHEI